MRKGAERMRRSTKSDAVRVLVVAVIVTLALAMTAAPARATGEDRPDQQQTVHVVQAGENLFRIALRYGTTVAALQAANNLSGTGIFVGQRLVIPSAGGASSGAPASAGTGTIHIVQRGDTLSAIALRYGVTTAALMQANNLASANLIYVGQQLAIPGGSGAAPASAGGTYTVQPGDTLSRIARLHGTTAAALASLNGLANPSAIYAGQVLRVSGTAAGGAVTGPKRILMDLSEQHLYAYQGQQLVYSFVASSGRAPTGTRTGEFAVQSKLPSAYGSAWNIWMPFWMGIYWSGGLENGIHALPILPNGQVLWAGYLGTPISFGCIVLGTNEAELLYNWAEIGTPVTVQW